MEISAAETTVDFSEQITNVQLTPTTIAVEIAGTYGDGADSVVFTMSVNGEAQGSDSKMTLSAESALTTAWTYPGTTLSLSFSSRQTAFRFTGAVSTEITLPTEHTHVTVDGIRLLLICQVLQQLLWLLTPLLFLSTFLRPRPQ